MPPVGSFPAPEDKTNQHVLAASGREEAKDPENQTENQDLNKTTLPFHVAQEFGLLSLSSEKYGFTAGGMFGVLGFGKRNFDLPVFGETNSRVLAFAAFEIGGRPQQTIFGEFGLRATALETHRFPFAWGLTSAISGLVSDQHPPAVKFFLGPSVEIPYNKGIGVHLWAGIGVLADRYGVEPALCGGISLFSYGTENSSSSKRPGEKR